MYRVVDHTADVGLEVRAPDMEGLFVDAAKGLQNIIFSGDPAVKNGKTIPVEVKAQSSEELLVGWLREILYNIQERGLVFQGAVVEFPDEGTMRGRAFMTEASGDLSPVVEIKLITYHGLRIERHHTEEGSGFFMVRLIFDV